MLAIRGHGVMQQAILRFKQYPRYNRHPDANDAYTSPDSSAQIRGLTQLSRRAGEDGHAGRDAVADFVDDHRVRAVGNVGG